jgi:cell division protein FtsL
VTGEAFEFAIKKDVRNNPIVREVDRDRHREMWRSTGVIVFVVLVILFSMWQRLQLRQFGYDMEPMQRSLADEREIERHLRLEIETLRSPERIERMATRDLRMIVPGPGDSEVIGRVVETPAPPGSVVARR